MNLFKPFQKQIRNRELYPEALKSMYFHLDFCGETHWKNWIAEDIEAWEDRRSVQHHLSAYGGMGSFNDIVICRENGHAIKETEEPWLNRIFNDLKSVCYYLAKNIPEKFSAEKLLHSMGCNAVLLQGWRCLHCGHGEVTKADIGYYVARHLIRDGVQKALTEGQIKIFVENVCRGNIENRDSEIQIISQAVQRSKITLAERSGWMRPCPQCNNDDTAVYRWAKSNDVFVPSTDNLEMKASL